MPGVLTFSGGAMAPVLTISCGSTMTLTAFFATDNGGENGIDDSEANGISITTVNGCTTVNGADGETVSVYDITGRMVASSHTGETIVFPTSGCMW